jgi:hypothetical protein
MQATANVGPLCGSVCGLGLISIIIGILVIVAFFAGGIYLTYWIYKRAVRNGILEAEKKKEEKR